MASCINIENGENEKIAEKLVKPPILITDQVYQLFNEAYNLQIDSVLPKKVTRKILMKHPLDRDLFASTLKNELTEYEADSIFIQQQLMITDTSTRSINWPKDWYNTELRWDSKKLKDIELTDLETLIEFVPLNKNNPEKFHKQWNQEYDYGFLSITVPVFNKDSTIAIIAEEMTNFDWFCGTGKLRVLKFRKVDDKWIVLNDY